MEIEGSEAAIGGPCGMGIISQTDMALLKPGDRVVAHRCNYDWVMTLFRDYLPGWGIEIEFVNLTDLENLVKSLKAKPAKFVHWEPYVNPTMEVLDTPSLIKIAKEAGAMVVVENTWLTPYLLQPFRIDAGLVIHSVTKCMGGHGNAMGGVISGQKSLVNKIGKSQSWLGGMLGVEWKTDAVHRNLGNRVKLILNATSLGDPVTRITPREEEKSRGITPRFTRVSIGMEESEDLIVDFPQAIQKCS